MQSMLIIPPQTRATWLHLYVRLVHVWVRLSITRCACVYARARRAVALSGGDGQGVSLQHMPVVLLQDACDCGDEWNRKWRTAAC